jgi:3-phosphoshikimate 1-carboxyvinyltransferase
MIDFTDCELPLKSVESNIISVINVMKLHVSKTHKLSGIATPPSSKSQTIRAVILASLAQGRSVLHNVLESDDAQAVIDVCRGLGVHITQEGGSLIVESSGVPFEEISENLFSRNSGITTKFVMPLLGLRKDSSKPIILDCGEQMKKRPLKPMIDALNQVGMRVVSENSCCPLSVTGKFIGGEVRVDGYISQYVSGLLLSAPYAQNDLVIRVRDLQEVPYVDMTLKWLDDLGVSYRHEQNGNEDVYIVKAGQGYRSFEKTIPVDFSSLSYPVAGACMVPGEVVLKGIDMDESQGDKRLIYILQEMGADITISDDSLTIRGGKELQGITIDANDIPDMLPTLAVLGTYAQGETRIVNVAQARVKETDRIHSMASGLGAMGAYIEEKEDGLVIRNSKLHGAQVHGYEDHRTVMALSLAGMLAEGETVIDTAESVGKTFPDYIEFMKKLGAQFNLI